MENLRAFFRWLEDESYIKKAPGRKIVIKAKGKAVDARHPFSSVQLNTLFSSPQYTGHLSSITRSKPGSELIKDGRYWIPLIGLFSGMRLDEIVQLLPTDIKQAQDTWYFDIARGEGEDKQLKTIASQRVVPVHPQLTSLGFLDFVEDRRAKMPGQRLFSEIEKGEDGYYSHNFSKWFAQFAKRVGVKTDKTTFHSFRHNFKDALVSGGVEDSHIKALLGHADSSVTSSYGSKISPTVLFKDVTRIDYKMTELFANIP